MPKIIDVTWDYKDVLMYLQSIEWSAQLAPSLFVQLLHQFAQESYPEALQEANVKSRTGALYGALRITMRQTKNDAIVKMYIDLSGQKSGFGTSGYAIPLELGWRQKPGKYVPAIGKKLKRERIPGRNFWIKFVEKVNDKLVQRLEEIADYYFYVRRRWGPTTRR